jgi:hypothetical protein
LLNFDAFDALVYPVFGVTLSPVIGHRLLDGEFGVLQLVEALPPQLCQPQLEQLCLWRGNGLDKSKDLFYIRDIGKVLFAVNNCILFCGVIEMVV